jgi:hypothetical protein
MRSDSFLDDEPLPRGTKVIDERAIAERSSSIAPGARRNSVPSLGALAAVTDQRLHEQVAVGERVGIGRFALDAPDAGACATLGELLLVAQG